MTQATPTPPGRLDTAYPKGDGGGGLMTEIKAKAINDINSSLAAPQLGRAITSYDPGQTSLQQRQDHTTVLTESTAHINDQTR